MVGYKRGGPVASFVLCVRGGGKVTFPAGKSGFGKFPPCSSTLADYDGPLHREGASEGLWWRDGAESPDLSSMVFVMRLPFVRVSAEHV